MSDVLRSYRKSFSWVVVALTICISVGFLTLLTVQNVSAEVVSLGDSESSDIKLENQPLVYSVDEKMKRTPFFHDSRSTSTPKRPYPILIPM